MSWYAALRICSWPSAKSLWILQSGLHAEQCEIDHKLHPLVCARKRNHLQTIQEETATNIYLPSPLQGVIGPDYGVSTSSSPQAASNRLSPNTVWITGEFFGVQRARDMLFKKSTERVSRVYCDAF